MSITKLKIALLAIAATFQVSAHASLADPREFQAAGHSWLSLTETAGLSANDILAGSGGWNANYRFATGAEVGALLASYGIANMDYTTTPFGRLGDFNYEIGGVTQFNTAGTFFLQGEQGAMGQGLDVFVETRLTNGDNGAPLGPNCPAYTSCSFAYVNFGQQSLNTSSSIVGNFLVRLDAPADVPEPASLAIFGLGGLLLAARRRAKGRA